VNKKVQSLDGEADSFELKYRVSYGFDGVMLGAKNGDKNYG